jgi:hypothetical protein
MNDQNCLCCCWWEVIHRVDLYCYLYLLKLFWMIFLSYLFNRNKIWNLKIIESIKYAFWKLFLQQNKWFTHQFYILIYDVREKPLYVVILLKIFFSFLSFSFSHLYSHRVYMNDICVIILTDVFLFSIIDLKWDEVVLNENIQLFLVFHRVNRSLYLS